MRQHGIPFFVPSIGEEEVESVVETLRSGWLTTGRKVKEFESSFSEFVGTRYAVATNSATSALHLALEAVGISPGDEVLVPTMTFASTGEVVLHLGAKPVLVDCDPDSFNMDPDDAERKVTPRTRAIVPVHYGGRPCDMDRLVRLARRRDLAVIEDAAHALPARYRGRMIGSIGDVTCFSFYANKTMTTGEGGMATTDRGELAERMRVMALHGISKDAWKRFSAEGSWYYEIQAPGYKYNMTDMAASLGIHQLRKCELFLVERRRCADLYCQGLEDVPEIETPTRPSEGQHAWHLYPIRLNEQRLRVSRAGFIRALAAAGIGTSVHYMPLHMHPLYRRMYGHQPGDLPVARSLYRRIVSLPIYPGLGDEDVWHVIRTIRTIVNDSRL